MDRNDTLVLTNLRRLLDSGEAREIRLSAGLSLQEAGAAIGTAATTVHRWEGGRRVPHGPLGVQYARFLASLQKIAK